MNNGKIKTFALLGLSAGVLMAQSGIEAEETHQPINLDYVLARPKCKAHGCGGLTAERELENANKFPKNETSDKNKDRSDNESDDDEDEEDDDEENDKDE